MNNKTIDIILYSAAIILLGLAFIWAGSDDAKEAEDSQAQYCMMVEIYKKNNGEYGWPVDPSREECK